MNVGIVTVCTQSYLPGTKVLFQSFLTNNHWFNGSFVCIDIDLTSKQRRSLRKFNPTFVRPSCKLVEQINRLDSNVVSDLNKSRLIAIDVFKIVKDFDRVIFLDSDMVVVKDIASLLSSDRSLACPDSCVLKGYERDKITYLPKHKVSSDNRYSLGKTVNTGFLYLQKSDHLLYNTLIEHLKANFFEGFKENLGDETLINVVLPNHFYHLSNVYNYRIHLEDEQYSYENIKYSDARILHFTGIYKPWLIKSYLFLIYRNAKYIKYLFHWVRYFCIFAITKCGL